MAAGERTNVAVVGAGQAGLATSYELSRAGIEHLVLERDSVGGSWRRRWDSFCLVTPNWSVRLPGGGYRGPDPDGFIPRDEIVDHLLRYADDFGAPIREGIDVRSLTQADGGGFDLETSDGDVRAASVVVCTGAYQRPYRPPGAAMLPADLAQVGAEEYRNPGSLAAGRVLVVGSGQTGCQIAEDLLRAGREVFLSCGRASWVPRRLGGRDIVWWLLEIGFMDDPVTSLASPSARLAANPQATGREGGHDLTARTLRDAGVTLLGHFLGADGGRARFAPDLAESIAWGDDRYREVMDRVRGHVVERGLPMPHIAEPAPFDADAPEDLDLSGFSAVVFTGGYRPDYGRWVHVPGAFDDLGFPIHRDGQSAVAPGLFFVGVHFLRTRKSSLLLGVGEDAAIVASTLAA